jgi:glycosyltransferase involved in cell wall biosynthesis
MTSPRVDIVLPIYNGVRYLARAIESALAQTYPHYEIIAVNDGSRDGSSEIVRRYLGSGRIRYVEQANQGVANARNTGIAHSSGKFIALLDQDDVWLSDKLEKQVAYMEAYPEVALLHARVACINGEGREIDCKGWMYVDGACGYCAERLLAGNRIAPLTVLIRRSCLDEVGTFRQAFAPADDWHLWLRIAVRYPLGFLDEVVGHYRVHDSNESKNLLKMKTAEIAVIESFCDSFPNEFQHMNRWVIESKLVGLHERAAEMLAAADRASEAAALRRKATRMKITSLWYYLRRLSFLLSHKRQSAILWYWYRIRSLFTSTRH